MSEIPSTSISSEQSALVSETSTPDEAMEALERRIGKTHFRQRLGIERDKEAKIIGQGRTIFHIENWVILGKIIEYGLILLRMLDRGKRNARAINLKTHQVKLSHLPQSFHGYKILQISDCHLDMASDIPHALIEAIKNVEYDICVFTGDFRGKTYGDIYAALEGLEKVRFHLGGQVYAILGNHDSLTMVPKIEELGIKVLLNENIRLNNGYDGEDIFLAGVDDPHYYRTDNFEKVSVGIEDHFVSILLAHTPEIYQLAAHAKFDLTLCGHTHGGQICLPGGFPLILNVDCPRRYAYGSWQYHDMFGYTSNGAGASVIDVRFNCPPEITLHVLEKPSAFS